LTDKEKEVWNYCCVCCACVSARICCYFCEKGTIHRPEILLSVAKLEDGPIFNRWFESHRTFCRLLLLPQRNLQSRFMAVNNPRLLYNGGNSNQTPNSRRRNLQNHIRHYPAPIVYESRLFVRAKVPQNGQCNISRETSYRRAN